MGRSPRRSPSWRARAPALALGASGGDGASGRSGCSPVLRACIGRSKCRRSREPTLLRTLRRRRRRRDGSIGHGPRCRRLETGEIAIAKRDRSVFRVRRARAAVARGSQSPRRRASRRRALLDTPERSAAPSRRGAEPQRAVVFCAHPTPAGSGAIDGLERLRTSPRQPALLPTLQCARVVTYAGWAGWRRRGRSSSRGTRVQAPPRTTGHRTRRSSPRFVPL